MMSSLDPFALSFDSIKVEPKPPAALPSERTALFAHSALPEEPGFYLLDDAGGRFSIDRATGIVTLAHDHVLELERDAIHPVHIKVIEHSGASYELNFRLRITGKALERAPIAIDPHAVFPPGELQAAAKNQGGEREQ